MPLALAAGATGAVVANHAAYGAPQTASKAGASVAAALAGSWGFTTISGTTYWDKSTGAYLGSGNGGSQTYTFYPNGRYKFFNYIKTNTYGWEMQALTWEEGTVSGTANGKSGTLKLTPTTGRYQVMDNRVRKNNYKRPMRAAERKVKKVVWVLEQRNGKPVLRMGSSQDKLVDYKKQP